MGIGKQHGIIASSKLGGGAAWSYDYPSPDSDHSIGALGEFGGNLYATNVAGKLYQVNTTTKNLDEKIGTPYGGGSAANLQTLYTSPNGNYLYAVHLDGGVMLEYGGGAQSTWTYRGNSSYLRNWRMTVSQNISNYIYCVCGSYGLYSNNGYGWTYRQNLSYGGYQGTIDYVAPNYYIYFHSATSAPRYYRIACTFSMTPAVLDYNSDAGITPRYTFKIGSGNRYVIGYDGKVYKDISNTITLQDGNPPADLIDSPSDIYVAEDSTFAWVTSNDTNGLWTWNESGWTEIVSHDSGNSRTAFCIRKFGSSILVGFNDGTTSEYVIP